MYKNITNKLLILALFSIGVLSLVLAIPQNVSAYYTGLCTPYSYQGCLGNNLYWYDSCGNQQQLLQYCNNGCYNNACQNYNNYYNYSNCTYHAYKLCVGNNIYWYDSCNNQQDLYQSCGSQFCQYGRCVYYVNPVNDYNPYARTSCYQGSVHWFDSLGLESGLYKSCNDNNSCTVDSCSGITCFHNTKCDGSTCSIGSDDYNRYCGRNNPTPAPVNQCGNGSCEPNLGENTTNCATDCKTVTPANISVSFFAKPSADLDQWQKNIQIGPDGQTYFMISVSNMSSFQVDNVIVSLNMPQEVSSLGNVQVNGVPVVGDIVTGINIGSIKPNSTKPITFEGKTQQITAIANKQAIATIDVLGNKQTDTIAIDFTTNELSNANSQASVSSAQNTAGLWGFLKKWYMWILIGLVLIGLFIIIFRRLSSEIQ